MHVDLCRVDDVSFWKLLFFLKKIQVSNTKKSNNNNNQATTLRHAQPDSSWSKITTTPCVVLIIEIISPVCKIYTSLGTHSIEATSTVQTYPL